MKAMRRVIIVMIAVFALHSLVEAKPDGSNSGVIVKKNFGFPSKSAMNEFGITVPTASTVWQQGQQNVQIHWNTGGLGGTVVLHLFKAYTEVCLIKSGASNDGEYDTWDVPSTYEPGTDYNIRIQTIGNGNIVDFSEWFEIESTGANISVTNPVSSTIWTEGQQNVPIQWETGNLGGNVKIELYLGSSLQATIAASTANNGSYSTWDVPTTLSAYANYYRVKITSLVNTGKLDYSDEFTITSTASFSITNPVSSTVWTQGQADVPITWSGNNLSGTVKIELYKGSSFSQTITTSTANDGSYGSWDVPSTITTGTDYKVKITLNENTAITGTSSNFTIQASGPPPPGISITQMTLGAASINQGEPVTLTIKLKNTGSGSATDGGIAVSFPQFTVANASGNLIDYSSSQGTVVKQASTTTFPTVQAYGNGTTIWLSSGSSTTNHHLLMEATKSTWAANEEQTFVLVITPQVTGTLQIKIRAWLSYGTSSIIRDPASSGTGISTDQQGYYTYDKSVNVNQVPLTITVSEPSANTTVNQGALVPVQWSATGPGGSVVTLKYDPDTDPGNGNEIQISSGNSLTGSTNWTTSSVPANSYYILGIVTSGSSTQTDYAPGKITITSQYAVTMEPYRISTANGAANTENPGAVKTQFIPGETVRITMRAKNTGSSVAVRCVLNIRGADNSTWVYDSHALGMDNSADSPLDPGENYDYYSFDWVIPANAQVGYYDIGGSMRNFSNFDLLYETTSPGVNSNFNGDTWILPDVFQVINGADNVPPNIEVWRVYQSGDERFRVVAKVTDAGSGVNPNSVKLIFYRLNCTFCTSEHNDMVGYTNYPGFYEGVSDQFDEGDQIIWKIEAKDMAGNTFKYPENLNLMTVQETQASYSDYCGRIQIHDFAHLNDANSFNYLSIPSGAVTFRMDGDDILVKNNTAIWYEMNITPLSLNPMAFTTVLTSQMLNPKGGYLPLTLDELVSEENARIPNAVSVDNITINVDRKSAAAMLRNSMDMILYGIKGINGAMPFGLGGFSGSLSKNDWDDIIDGAFFASNVTDLLLAWLQTNNPPTWEASLYSLQLLLEPAFQGHLKAAIYNKLLQKANDPTFAFGFMGTTVTPIVNGVYDLIQGLQNRTKFILDLLMYPDDNEAIMLGKASPLKLDESTIPGGFSYQGSQRIYCGQQSNFNLTVNVPPGNVRPYFKTYALIKIYSPQGGLVETTKINDYNFNPTGGLIVQFNGLTDNSQGASWNPLRFNNAIGINVVYSFTTSTTGHQYQSSFKPYSMEVILYQNGLPGINVNPFEPDAEISTGKIPFRIYDNTNPQKPVIAGVSTGMDLYNFGFYLEPAEPDIYYYKVYRKFPGETSFTYVDSIRNGNKERLYFYDHFTEPRTSAVYKIQAIDISDNVSTFSDEFPILIATLPPALFHLNSPSDNQVVTSQTPLLNWGASTDPDGTAITYDLYLSTNAVFTNPTVISNLTQASYQFTAPLADNTIYYWKVKAKDAINESRWSYEESWKFAVNLQNQAPGSFSLTEPNQTTVGSLKPTLKWQASSDPDPFDAVKYTLVLATTSNFSNAVEFSNIQSTQYTPGSSLNPSTTYYWKVKAVDNQNQPTWSTQTSWSFVTPALPNALPELTWTGEQFFEFDGVDPNNGDTLTSFSYKVLYKDADGDAPLSGYPRLVIMKNGNAISGSPFALTQLDNNAFASGRKYGYTMAPLTSGTDYTYSFEARDSKNALATGEPVQPHTGPDVNYLKVLAPDGGQALVANQQYSVTWFSRGDFEKFFILFSPDNGIGWQTINPDLDPLSSSYSWIVPVVSTFTARIKIGGVYSIDTVFDISDNVFSVSIPVNAPNPFSLVSPHNIDVTTLTPMLSWNSTTDPNGAVIAYELWYSTDSTFVGKTIVTGLSTNQYTLPQPLTDNTRYFWKVKAIDADGLITWSTQKNWYFNVNLVNNGPSAPSPASPANGSALLNLLPQFAWTPVEDPDPGDTVKYELWVGNNITFANGTYQVYPNILTNSFTPPQALSLNTTWYWKVFSVDNHGSKTASIETDWWFTTPVAIPQLTVTPSTLNFASTPLGVYSSYAHYDLSGMNLSSTVNISSPPGVLISFDSLINYSNFLTVFPVNRAVNQKRIFVVFAPNSIGSYSDSIVNSSVGATSKKVFVNGTGNNLPAITLSGSGLSFGNVLMNTCSNPQNYLISGHNLTGNLTVTAPAGYQVSTASTTGFAVSVSLTPVSGTVATTKIYAKFCPPSAMTYTGTITHTSAGTATQSVTVSGTVINSNACPGQPTVIYAGKIYNTVQIGSQCWLRENLNVGTRINGSLNQTNNSTIEKYCYNDLESNCDIYGGLYKWDEMMQYLSTEGSMGICPTGWHLPSDGEWTILTTVLDGESVAGGKMKETGYLHWQTPNTGATNSSGFTALPGGLFPFQYINLAGVFWTSTTVNTSGAWMRSLNNTSTSVGKAPYGKSSWGLSVRCLKDPDISTSTPTLTTISVSNITQTTATSGGNVTSDGGATVTARGVCWSNSQNPTISDNHSSDGTGIGTFTSTITGLQPNTTYYVRAYATNAAGTAYGNTVSMTTQVALPPCGTFTITVSHLAAGGVAPVDKTVTYGTVTNIPGEPSKCWITRNLGASQQASAVNDATEASAGWYWQFNRKQGYKHDGTTRTPNTTWIFPISENFDWQALNDPCTIELGYSWRIPSYTEWFNVDNIGGWNDWNGPYNSALKMHAAGMINATDGSMQLRGSTGDYWSNTQINETSSWTIHFNSGFSNMGSASDKAYGWTLRCLREAASFTMTPTVTTTSVSNIGQTYATSGGNVTNDGGAIVTARGVCWSISQNPTIANSYTTDGTDVGTFTSTISGLQSNTSYYVRAYATNLAGTAYGNTVSFTTQIALPPCGTFTITVSHLVAGGVAPIDKTVTYGTVTNIPGEPSKCWITRNLGASQQASAVNDATEASAGWYWQFNRKQGYKHDGMTRTPNTTWITSISENSNWTTLNDPCTFELGSDWRIPTTTEWTNVDASGSWTNWNGPWTSGLKMHAAGYLHSTNGSLLNRGINGYYFSGIQNDASNGITLYIQSDGCGMFYYGKVFAFSLRCLKESGTATTPNVTTISVVSNIGQTTATSGGNVINDGGSLVTARGVCWSTSLNPTIANNYTTDGTGIGIFTSTISGLQSNTTYYVRAYATNINGTAYGNQVNFTTQSVFICGSSIIKNHVEGLIAPVTKTTTYGTVTNIPGEPTKCWITSNLGADHQATTVNDATESSAGWYWQFNRKQGYKHDGTFLTPSWTITSINENSDWTSANDPCSIELGSGWHIPTSTEWSNVEAIGSWTNSNGPWNSELKIHSAGYLENLGGTLNGRGSTGGYVSSSQYNQSYCSFLSFFSNFCLISNFDKADGRSIRCIKEPGSALTPTVTTSAVSNITQTTASSGGNVTSDGGVTVAARGVCWSTSQNPTIEGNHTTDGTGIGTFPSTISGLATNTTYYVRAYATNSVGMGYGNEISFTTLGTTGQPCPGLPTFTDQRDSKVYNTVQIGDQCWLKENMNYSSVTSYCYGNNSENCNIYGRLYDWQTAKIVCPSGWHLSSNEEWSQLEDLLGGASVAGGQLKESGFIHWNSPNTGATNSTGFTALPGGFMGGMISQQAWFWTSSEYDLTRGFDRIMYYNNTSLNNSANQKSSLFSVRCIKDNCTSYLPVSVSIAASANPVSAGTAVTYTATPVNGGDAPNYQWKVNGTNTGTNTSTCTYTPINNDIITCIVTSHLTCVSNNPATSNAITMIVTTNLLQGLSAYWKLDGNLLDSYGSNHWTNYGSIDFSIGKINNCRGFNQNTTTGQYAEATSISLTSEATMSFWFYSYGTQPEHAGVLFKAYGSPHGDQPIFGAQAELIDLIFFNAQNPSGVGDNLSFTFNHNTWYHFVWVFDGPNYQLRLYVNGVKTTKTISFNTLYNPNTKIKIGMQKYGERSFHGQLDEIGIWTRALTDQEVSLLYNNGQGNQYPFTGILINYSIHNVTIGTGLSKCYNAIQTITVAGNSTTFTVQNGGSATMIAGQNIIYLPNTIVHMGGYLWGYIAPSGPWCVTPSMPVVTMSKDESPEKIQQSSFRLYPNPTTGNFFIELAGDSDNITVEIYGPRGEKVLTTELNRKLKHEVSLSDNPVGVYFVRVISGSKVETVKVIKQ